MSPIIENLTETLSQISTDSQKNQSSFMTSLMSTIGNIFGVKGTGTTKAGGFGGGMQGIHSIFSTLLGKGGPLAGDDQKRSKFKTLLGG